MHSYIIRKVYVIQKGGYVKLMQSNNCMLLGVDNGCTYTKTSTRRIFPSRVTEVEEFMELTGDIRLELNGKKYLVGIGEDNIDTDKTTNEKTRILTYAALAMHAPANQTTRFKIVVGTPMSHYIKDRYSLRDYLVNHKYQRVVLNGHEKYIAIDEAIPFPQSTGAYFYHIDKFKGRLVGVVDIGGVTIDCSLYDDGKLVPDAYFTLRHGMKVINTEVKNRLNARYGTNLKEQDMQRIYREGFRYKGTIQKDAYTIISETINRNVDKIIYDISLNWDLNTMDIVLCGGGALDLEEYLKPVLPHAFILDDPQFANALGFGKAAEVKWRSE